MANTTAGGPPPRSSDGGEPILHDILEDDAWQMTAGERAAIVGILADLAPNLAIEIGTGQGGSLRRIAAHSEHVHAFDDSRPADELIAALPNVTFHTGDSHQLLPQLLARLADEKKQIGFALVDGDHSPAGVARDVEDLLASSAVDHALIVLHDTANPHVRAGLDAIDYASWPKVRWVDLDWIPGSLYREGPALGQAWGGLGVILVDPKRRPVESSEVVASYAHPTAAVLATYASSMAGSPKKPADRRRPPTHETVRLVVRSVRRRLAASLRGRLDRGRGWPSDASQPVTEPAAPAEDGALRADLERLAGTLQVVQRQRSPMLWNETDADIPESPGTITMAVRALAAGGGASSSALQAAVDRFEGCAQGPLLGAIDITQLRALAEADPLPIPPPAAREWYYDGDDLSYWMSGLGDRLLLEDLGRRLDRPLAADSRLLDFGSSSGRVLRHFANATPQMRAFGVDLGRHNVEWARYHLQPRVTVVQGSTLPHLPFPDGYFDCIYAGSVFTHISDFEEAWLLELSRVLAPSGFAVLTFHPERTWNEMGSDPDHFCRRAIERGPHRLEPGSIEPVGVDVFERPMPAGRVVLTLTTWPVNNANVFHSDAWIQQRWGHFFDLQSIVTRAHAVYQDAAILTQRSPQTNGSRASPR